MNILPLKTNDKAVKPGFKGIEHFDHIKKLDGMICAACGRRTLASDVFVKANTPNCKSLLYNMQRQALSFVEERFPEIWNLLLRFTKQFPDQSLDCIMSNSDCYIELKQGILNQICKENGVEEPTISDKARFDRSIGATFFDLLESARTHLEPASVVMRNLSGLKCYLSEEQARAFSFLEGYAENYPEKTLSEIINMEEVYTYHANRDRKNRKKLYDDVHYCIDNIHSMILDENPDALTNIFHKRSGVITMFKDVSDPEERIYNMKEIYRHVLVNNGCENLIEKVYAEIDKVPKVFMTADTFLAFAHEHNFSDGKIIAQLFNSNFATEEHLDAVAEGGEDRIENKIVMHKACNQLRNRIAYSRFVKYHPEMQSNVQQQVDLVVDALLKGDLPSFIDFYPLKMPLKLAEKTDNLIKIDITRYCQEGIKQSWIKENNLREELYLVTDSRDRKIREKMLGKRPNPALDKEISFLHSEIFRIKESIKIEGKRRFRMQEYLKSQGVQE